MTRRKGARRDRVYGRRELPPALAFLADPWPSPADYKRMLDRAANYFEKAILEARLREDLARWEDDGGR